MSKVWRSNLPKYLVTVTRREPVSLYLVDALDEKDIYSKVEHACGLTRRAQIFTASSKPCKDGAFNNLNAVEMNEIASVYLNGEMEEILERYIRLTEEMNPTSAIAELRHAVERFATEIEKCQTDEVNSQNIDSTGT